MLLPLRVKDLDKKPEFHSRNKLKLYGCKCHVDYHIYWTTIRYERQEVPSLNYENVSADV